MSETERQNQLKWFQELRMFIVKGDTDIASQMVTGAILLLERKSKNAATTTENTRLKLVKSLALND